MSDLRVSLAGALLLFVASRLLYLVLIDPVYVLAQPGDELYIGTIAQELVTGPVLPFTEYRANNFALGTLVVGALAAGFFRLFGPTVFALKLTSLLIYTLVLAFWYWTIQRAAGERVAGYFAVLFCVSPPLFTAYSVAALGGHGETILFSGLTVFLLFRMLPEEKPSAAYPALLGLTAGFGLWFAYIYGLALLTLLGFWLWHDKGRFWGPRVLWFAMGFVVGFSPWIIINAQNHFAGLVVHGRNVWEHFGLDYLWDDLAHPRTLAPVEFLRTIASDDSRDLYRRAVNLLYALLYLGPILTAGILRWKAVRSGPAGANYRGMGTHPTRPMLVWFGILYLVVFVLAVQFSDFRDTRYNVPAYPFLFLFAAHALAYCQDRFPLAQRQIQNVFLASAVLLSVGTHAPLVSLERPGAGLSIKGYSYALLPSNYLYSHAPGREGGREFILQMVQRPFLSDILPKLSADDQRDFSLAIALRLAEVVPLDGPSEDFARIERLVPPGFERHFYYWLGVTARGWHQTELPKALAAVDFLRHQSATAHHLALVGTYREWPLGAAQDWPPESFLNPPEGVAPELSPHYWRAVGYSAARYWYETSHSLSQLKAHLQGFVPRLDPSVQRYVLEGVGKYLFDRLIMTPWVSPSELERFPPAYQGGLLEGWGMALREEDIYSSPFSWTGHENLLWTAATKDLSARSLVSIQRGKAHFDALFEGPAASALKPAREIP